jgi:ppGpp synthetase/RelA/SpoT-type nucleotidyltranferase
LERLEQDRIRIEFPITGRLKDAGLRVFAVTGRVKALASYERKLRSRPTRPIQEVLAFRVITFVELDIPAVEAVIRMMFRIDESTRVDKVTTRDPYSFGYRSVQAECRRVGGLRRLLRHVVTPGVSAT